MMEPPVEKAGNWTNAVEVAELEEEGREPYLSGLTMFSQSFMQCNNTGALHSSLHGGDPWTFPSNCSNTRSNFAGECEEARGKRRRTRLSTGMNEASEPKFYIVVAENDMTRKGRREGIAIAGRGGCRYMKTCESPNFASPATAAKIPRQSTRSRSLPSHN